MKKSILIPGLLSLALLLSGCEVLEMGPVQKRLLGHWYNVEKGEHNYVAPQRMTIIKNEGGEYRVKYKVLGERKEDREIIVELLTDEFEELATVCEFVFSENYQEIVLTMSLRPRHTLSNIFAHPLSPEDTTRKFVWKYVDAVQKP